jgi:Holliday junction resolvasome RuvABC endonuclease subunit
MQEAAILALDLSSRTGWAFGRINARSPEGFGTWMLPMIGGEGARYAAFENELAAMIQTRQPTHLVMEAPLSFAALLGVSNMKTMCQQLTLRGIGYSEAYRASISCREVSAEIVRDAILGKGRFPKGTVKSVVVAHCWKQGWRVPDDNAGDAVLTWAWLAGQLRGSQPVAGRLFA